MADDLRIVINTDAAQVALRQLNDAVKSLTQGLTRSSTSISTGFKNIAREVATLQPPDKRVAQAMRDIASAAKALSNLRSVGTLTKNLTKLEQVNLGRVASNMRGIADAMQSIRIPAGLKDALNTIQQLSIVAPKVSTNLRKLGTSATSAASGINKTRAAASDSVNAMDALNNSVKQLVGAYLGIQGIRAFSSALYDAGTAMTQFGLAMQTISDPGTATADIVARIKDIANDTATDMKAVSAQFQQFAIAGKISGLEIDQSEKIFKSFSVALRVLGKDTNSQRLAFLALTQMISKGRVQSEELRRQLAEQLPGAFEIFAQAAGVSTAELDKLMREGKALAKDILPKVADILTNKFGGALAGAMKTPVAQITLLKNRFFELFDIIARGRDGFSGTFVGLTDFLVAVNEAFNTEAVKSFANVVGQTLNVAFQGVAALVTTVSNGFSGLYTVLSSVVDVFKMMFAPIGDIVSLIGGIADVIGQSEMATNAFASAVEVLSAAVGGLIAVGLGKWFISLAASSATAVASFLGLSTAQAAATTTTAAMTAAQSTAIVSTNGLSLSLAGLATAVRGVMAALGGWTLVIAAATAAVGYAISKYQEMSQAQDELAKKAEISAATVAKGDASLTKYAESLKLTAEKLNLSNEETQQYIDLMVKAAAGPEKMAKAYREELDALREKLTWQQRVAEELKNMREQEEINLRNAGASSAMISKMREKYDKFAKSIGVTIESTKGLIEQKELLLRVQENLAKKSADEQAAAEKAGKTYQQNAVNVGEYNKSVSALATAQAGGLQQTAAAANTATSAVNELANAADSAAKKVEGKGDEYYRYQREAIDALDKVREYNRKAKEEEKAGGDASIWRKRADDYKTYAAEAKLSAKEAAEAYKLDQQSRAEWAAEVDKANAQATAGSLADNAKDAVSAMRDATVNATESFQKLFEAANQKEEITTLARAFPELNKVILENRDAMISMVGWYEEFQIKADRFSASTTAMVSAISSLKDTLPQLNTDLENMQTVLESVAKAPEASATALGTFNVQLEQTAGAVAAILPNMQQYGELVNLIADALPEVAEAQKVMSEAFVAANAQYPTVNENLGQMNATVALLREPMAAIATAFALISEASVSLPEQLAGVVVPLTQLQPLVEKTGPQLNAVSDAMKAVSAQQDDLRIVVEILTMLGQATSATNAAASALNATYVASIEFFNNAVTAVNDLSEAYSDLRDTIDEVIRSYHEMAQAQSQTSSGGETSINVGAQREGGYATNAVQSQSVAKSAFANAPKLAEGIANTNSLTRSVAGGGIPTILHPNEAVVPLSRGRNIPVDLNITQPPAITQIIAGNSNLAEQEKMLKVMTDISSRIKSVDDILSQINDSARTTDTVKIDSGISQNVMVSADKGQKVQNTQPIAYSDAERFNAPSVGKTSGKQTQVKDTAVQEQTNTKNNGIVVNFNVYADDVDSFNRSSEQIKASLYESMKRAYNSQN